MGAHQDLAVAGSSPELRIAEVSAGAGTIGVTFCPGKQGPGQGGTVHARSVEADMDAIRRWGASAVVTLIEAHEFGLLSVTALPNAVRAAGLEWHHLPIVDMSVPDAAFERHWRYAGLRVRRRLRAGERVLVHCRGGLGRAGLVAASLLVELGVARPAEAIASVRAVRPGAIETSAQARWVEGRRIVSPTGDERAARELGCLLGGAIGGKRHGGPPCGILDGRMRNPMRQGERAQHLVVDFSDTTRDCAVGGHLVRFLLKSGAGRVVAPSRLERQ